MYRATRIAVGALPATKHGSEGKQERIVREVADPVTGKRRDVVSVVRRGGIDEMWARGSITDDQKAAADRFAELYERAHSDGVRAIDYGNIRVDCGAVGGSYPGAGSVRARQELERVRRGLGHSAFCLIVLMAAKGHSLRSLARSQTATTDRGVTRLANGYSRSLKQALCALDRLWNVAEGAGSGIRADGARGEVLVETAPVDKFAGMSDAELVAFTHAVGDALKGMVGKGRSRLPEPANSNERCCDTRRAG